MEVSKEFKQLHTLIENRLSRFHWFVNNEGPQSPETISSFLALCVQVDKAKEHADYGNEISYYARRGDAEGLSGTFMAKMIGQVWSYGYIMVEHASTKNFEAIFGFALPQIELDNGIVETLEA